MDTSFRLRSPCDTGIEQRQGRRFSAALAEEVAFLRSGLVATCEEFERQIEAREPGFLIREAQLEATPGFLPPGLFSSPPETVSAEAHVIVGVSLGLHLQIDAAAMEAALGCWDKETPCLFNAEFSAGHKKQCLKAIPSSGQQSLGYSDFLVRSCATMQETIAPFLENGCLVLKVCVTADA